MARTYDNLITEARALLKDTDADTKRYTDSSLLNILNLCLQDLCRMRPDACYDLFLDNSLNVPEVVDDSPAGEQILWTVDFNIEMQFYTPLVIYVVGMAEVTDDEYTTDGRAALLLRQFRNTAIGI